jgi:hypothetical protein
MAFMLMVPVEPVVAELARVLRSGGSFSAVVGSTLAEAHASVERELETQRALWTRIGAALRQFWDAEYPRLQTAGRLGDPRASTLDGWKELFRPETGFTGAVEVQDLEILIRESADGLWSFFGETYLVDLLDAKMREKRVSSPFGGEDPCRTAPWRRPGRASAQCLPPKLQAIPSLDCRCWVAT